MTQVVGILSALLVPIVLPCVIALFVMFGDSLADRIARLWWRPTAMVRASVARMCDVSRRLRRTPHTDVYTRATLLDRYDRALRNACAAAGVDHWLNDLTGLDRDMERLRLVDRLTETGLIQAGRDCRG